MLLRQRCRERRRRRRQAAQRAAERTRHVNRHADDTTRPALAHSVPPSRHAEERAAADGPLRDGREPPTRARSVRAVC